MEDNKVTAEVADRKEGYYWVRIGGVWEVAKYYVSNGVLGNYWSTFGEHEGCWSNDDDFNEIDERQICRS